MGMAGGAQGDLPAVAGKPGEVGGRVALGLRSGRLTEAADFEGDAGRVEKGVFVAAIDRDGLATVAHRRATDSAVDGLVIPFFGRAAGVRARRSGSLGGG